MIELDMELLDLYKASRSHCVISKDTDSDRVSHAYLLECSDEYLLREYALYMAKQLYCLDANSPCDKCINCIKIAHGNMVDLTVLPIEKTLVTEDINRIVSDCYTKPIENDFKMYILNNFDLCTIQGMNKLLKTLEDPPRKVVFVLTCTNVDMVLPTVLSRVKKIAEGSLDPDLLKQFLTKRNVANAGLLASISGGSVARALRLSDGGGGIVIVTLVFELLQELKTSANVLYFSSKILALKKDGGFFLDTLLGIVRDMVVVGTNPNIVVYGDKIEQLTRLAGQYSPEVLHKVSLKICDAIMKLDANCNPVGVIDKLLLDILEIKFLCQK